MAAIRTLQGVSIQAIRRGRVGKESKVRTEDIPKRYVEVQLAPGVPFLLPGNVVREREEEARRRDLILKAA